MQLYTFTTIISYQLGLKYMLDVLIPWIIVNMMIIDALCPLAYNY